MLVRCKCGWEKDVKDELRGKILVCPKCERQCEAVPVDDSEGWLPPGVEIGKPEETTFIRPAGRIELSEETKRFLETRPSGPPPRPKVTWVHHAIVLCVFFGVPLACGRVYLEYARREIDAQPAVAHIDIGEICHLNLAGLRRFAANAAACDALYEAERANDLHGLAELARREQVVAIDGAVQLRKLQHGVVVVECRIESGLFVGQTAMIPPEYLAPGPPK